MTPTETFAKSRIEAETLIRQYAPARLQDAVIERLLPAIALTATPTDDFDIAIGASKFGGAPDVAAGFEWPSLDDKTLVFVAQINLEAIAPFDLNRLLPGSGLLSFFYDMNEDGEWPFGEMGDEGGWRVFHLQGELTRAAVPAKAQNSHGLKTATVTPNIFCDVPTSVYWVGGEEIEFFQASEVKDLKECENFLQNLPTVRSALAMLGHPAIIQDDARRETVWTTKRGASDDWIVLLQMDMDDEIDWFWGTGGAMFYLMHRDDLANRDFDKCWLNAQC